MKNKDPQLAQAGDVIPGYLINKHRAHFRIRHGHCSSDGRSGCTTANMYLSTRETFFWQIPTWVLRKIKNEMSAVIKTLFWALKIEESQHE